MDFLASLISDIVANVIFWVGLGFLTWLSIKTTQSRFQKFFGLDTNRTLVVYLSNLWRLGEARPPGCVISGFEFRATESISSLFGIIPFRFPNLVRGLVDAFWTRNRPRITVSISPLAVDDLEFTSMIEFTNMIVVGGTPKNSVRRYYFRTNALYLAIEGEERALDHTPDVFEKVLLPSVRVMKGQRKGEIIGKGYNLAIVEKIRDEEHGTVVFMCVGYRGDSSWAATEYLVRNWSRLHRITGNKVFALCLGFPKSEVHMDSYMEPIILASFPL